MSALSVYSTVLFVHVLAGVVLVGTSLLAPITRNIIREATSVDALTRALEFDQRTMRWNPAAAFVVLASGVYLGIGGWWTEGWFYIAVFAWIVNSLIAAVVQHRTSAALMQAASRATSGLSAEIDWLRWSRAWNLALAVMLANDVAILYVMFNKPSLTGSITLLTLANLLFVGVFSLTSRRATQVGIAAGAAAIAAPPAARR